MVQEPFITFGETRLSTGSMYTDKLFTGQRQMAGLGIYHYQSRFYSPKLGRFLSADTIVPNPVNPQDFNRFSYVRNNPVRYIDPSGHVCSDPDDLWSAGCENGAKYPVNAKPLGASKVIVKVDLPTSQDLQQKKPKGGGGGNGGGSGDGGIVLTITRDELNDIGDIADDLGEFYQTRGENWEDNTATILTAISVFVDIPTCVVGAALLETPCLIALGVELVLIPTLSDFAGVMGGSVLGDEYDAISDYVDDVLDDNPTQENFTVTVETTSVGTFLLPGGVGIYSDFYSIAVGDSNSRVLVGDRPEFLELFGGAP